MVRNPPSNAGDIRDMGSIPGSRRSLEEGMASYSSILAWEISWSEETGRLPSMGSQKSWTWLKQLSRDVHWRLGDKGPALVDVISQKTMWQLSKEIHTRRQRSAGLQGLLSDYVSGRRCEYSGLRLYRCADLEGEGRQFVSSFAVADDETFPVFFRLET